MSDVEDAGASPVNVEQVMAEIHAEVRRRRATGELPSDLEQELDAVFARFAPAGTAEEDFADLLDKVERASFVDANPPVASNLPGGQAVKNAVRRATGFAMQHLSQQISAFDYAVTRALRRLDERLRAVEGAPSYALGWPLAVEPPRPDLAPWIERIVLALADAPGRVLVADAADGAVVDLLRSRSVDAYGTDPTPGAAAQAPPGAEIRESEVLEHLAALADHVLGGLVLAGSIDTMARNDQLAVVGRAGEVLAPGGRLAIVGSRPEVWATQVPPVVLDLAEGSPLHAETWAHVLEAGPFTAPEIVQETSSPTYLVLAVRH